MATIDKAAIGFTIAIVAAGVGFALYGSSVQDLSTGVQAPEALVRPGTAEQPSYQETAPKVDPFADIASEVKEKAGQAMPEKTMPEKTMPETMPEKTMPERTMPEQPPMQETKPAGPQTVTVSIPEGTSVPGCEETDECYIPATVTIKVGDTVVWSNDDTAAHTVTSGTPTGGPDGKFDSSLLMAAKTFEYTFDTAGTYDYFCMVHPWMVGTVIVE